MSARDLEMSAITAAPVADSAMSPALSKMLIDAYLSGADEGELSGILAPSRGSVVKSPAPSTSTPRSSVLYTLTEDERVRSLVEDLATNFVANVMSAVESHQKRKRKAKPSKRTAKKGGAK